MKLVRFGEIGREKPGLIDPEGALRSLEGIVYDIGGNILNAAMLAELRAQDHTSLPEVTGDAAPWPSGCQRGQDDLRRLELRRPCSRVGHARST